MNFLIKNGKILRIYHMIHSKIIILIIIIIMIFKIKFVKMYFTLDLKICLFFVFIVGTYCKIEIKNDFRKIIFN
jgi:hypothetical protein